MNKLTKRICALMTLLLLPLTGCDKVDEKNKLDDFNLKDDTNSNKDDSNSNKNNEQNIVPTGTYKVTFLGVTSGIDYIPEDGFCYLTPGTEMVLRTSPIMDGNMSMFVDGEFSGIGTYVDKGLEYSFVMPEHDTVVEFEFGYPDLYLTLFMKDNENSVKCPYKAVDGKGTYYINSSRFFYLNIKGTHGNKYKGDIATIVNDDGTPMTDNRPEGFGSFFYESSFEETTYRFGFFEPGNYKINVKVGEGIYSLNCVCSNS